MIVIITTENTNVKLNYEITVSQSNPTHIPTLNTTNKYVFIPSKTQQYITATIYYSTIKNTNKYSTINHMCAEILR